MRSWSAKFAEQTRHRGYHRHHRRLPGRPIPIQRTRDLVDHLQFDNAFVFRYSRDGETRAATMSDQVDESLKEARNQDCSE